VRMEFGSRVQIKNAYEPMPDSYLNAGPELGDFNADGIVFKVSTAWFSQHHMATWILESAEGKTGFIRFGDRLRLLAARGLDPVTYRRIGGSVEGGIPAYLDIRQKADGSHIAGAAEPSLITAMDPNISSGFWQFESVDGRTNFLHMGDRVHLKGTVGGEDVYVNVQGKRVDGMGLGTSVCQERDRDAGAGIWLLEGHEAEASCTGMDLHGETLSFAWHDPACTRASVAYQARLFPSAKQQVRAAILSGFPAHFVLDDVFPTALIDQVAEEVPEDGSEAAQNDAHGCLPHYPLCSHSLRGHWDEPKSSGLNYLLHEWRLPPATRELFGLLRSAGFVDFLSAALGVVGLVPDPQLIGSGVHNALRGGFLRLHADINWAPKFDLYRSVIVMVYLNRDWEDSYGGHLELWNGNLTACGARVLPVLGRIVAFLASDVSYHGYPHPLQPPPGRSRRGVAMYYYTTKPVARECRQGACRSPRPTLWVKVDCKRCRGTCCPDHCTVHGAS